MPVIPFSLINGARGIGTGMKAFVPSYHPKDVVRAVEAVWANENVPAIVPWYRGFRGRTVREGAAYKFEGVVERVRDNKAIITELPPGKSTEACIAKLRNRGYTVQSLGTDTEVCLHVEGDALSGKDDLVALLDLSVTVKLNEMQMIDPSGGFTLYDSVDSIVRAHHAVAMATYERRRLHEIRENEALARAKREKAHYIQGFVDGRIAVPVQPGQVEAWMASGGFARVDTGALKKVPTGQLYAENIERLNREIEELEKAIAELQGTSAMDLWKRDMETFKGDLEAMWEEE